MSNSSKKRSNLEIKSLRLTARNRETVDLDTYYIELNIHEDIFGNALYGTLLVSDSRNLSREMALEGDEELYIHAKTEGFSEDDPYYEIRKEFRVFNVTDRIVNFEKGLQSYILHFCSKEVFVDTLTPLYRPFEGTITEVADLIFHDYVRMPRYPGGEENTLTILDEVANPVKFISPGWSPFKCMNWLASKSISTEGSACNYLFWETSKGFYFGSVEKIFIDLAHGNRVLGYYRSLDRDQNLDEFTVKDPNREFFAVNSFQMQNANDMLKLTAEGELASTALCVDLNKKEFTNTTYRHTEEYEKYTHLMPFALSNAIWGSRVNTNPKNSIKFIPKNTHLFDEFDNNVNEVYKDVFGKRVANLRDINNFKINISIMGRTDIQAGSVLHLEWPDTLLKANDGYSDPGYDRRYTGYYLVTSVRHKITPFNYICLVEVVKDAFDFVLSSNEASDYVF